MLYVTTRSDRDAFTAHRAMIEDRAPDGGLFVPFRMPCFESDRICSLRDLSVGESIAQILSLFFPVQLSGWDVDFCIGRNPVKITAINHKVFIAEKWHNPESDYAYIERSLYNKLCGDKGNCGTPSEWSKIAIRIAVMFGVFCELPRLDECTVDVAVDAGDISTLIAVLYAREMGLPISMIICGCDENRSYSDLLRRGMITGMTALPSLLQTNLERLIYTMFGQAELSRFLDACNCGRSYTAAQESREALKNGMFSAVIGSARVHSLIDGLQKTNAYTMETRTAIAFGGLQDYRATNRENRFTLLLADRRPDDSR